MERRQFMALLGGAAAWPLAARAQRGDRVRRIGVLMPSDENDPGVKLFVSAFIQALAALGWTDGRNVRMDLRQHGGDINRIRALAQELVSLKPDIIVAGGNLSTVAVERETRTIPIVFASLADPVANSHGRAARPPGREQHRLRQLGSLVGRQVARAALGDRARPEAGRNHVQSRHCRHIGLYALT